MSSVQCPVLKAAAAPAQPFNRMEASRKLKFARRQAFPRLGGLFARRLSLRRVQESRFSTALLLVV